MIPTFDEFANPYHIIVLFDKSERNNMDYLAEGIWTSSGEKDYWQRLDKPKFDFEQLHVHIARQKHINTKSKQVAWNVDGTKHDKKTFNQNFNGMEKAKQIARKALGLKSDAVLEFIEHQGVGQLLLESVEYLPAESSVFIFKLIDKTKNQILHS